ncbi:MAG: Dam family site-specific DNA-(adenine-N6)-methyltransferase [Desulfamplus sp.]|nr:Dam family site-specific DNA-(adenine-N6)-methyltransferase [Desulfamplus sp.]
MISKTYVPPIKSQGIKTKLIPWIKSIISDGFKGAWIEPFMGTGAVAFNIAPKRAILSDTNPHLINFYSQVASNKINPEIVKSFLQKEGKVLLEKGEDHYYFIRDRFNKEHDPLDFLFLNRAGFNGMIRFNRKGGFNIPFCRKPERFAKAYITKITNQITWVANTIASGKYQFICQDFKESIKMAAKNDIIYSDPPYIERHVDYFNGWNEKHETELYTHLSKFDGHFILSTWHHNDYRENEYIKTLWSDFHILTKDHFYHVGGSEKNRNPMVEALITNFIPISKVYEFPKPIQYELLEKQRKYC